MITIPLMKPQLLFGAINSRFYGSIWYSCIGSRNAASNYAAHTIVAHLYDYAIRFQMGHSSKIAVVLFLITFILGRVCMKIFSSKDIY